MSISQMESRASTHFLFGEALGGWKGHCLYCLGASLHTSCLAWLSSGGTWYPYHSEPGVVQGECYETHFIAGETEALR